MHYSHKPMSAMPNAGLPSVVEGRQIYLCSPEYMAQYARRFLDCRGRIIGGCCGTTAEHIKLIHAEVRSLRPQTTRLKTTVEEPVAKVKALPKFLLAQKANSEPSSPLENSSRSSRFFPLAAWTLPKKSRAPSNAPRTASIASTCGRPARQCPHERPGYLPAHPGAGQDRGRSTLLLSRPQHSQYPIRIAWRAYSRHSQSDLHHRRSAAHGHLSRCHPRSSTWTPLDSPTSSTI